MFMFSKTNLFFKVISFVILQSFLFTNITFAAGVNFNDTSYSDCLSPNLSINNVEL